MQNEFTNLIEIKKDIKNIKTEEEIQLYKEAIMPIYQSVKNILNTFFGSLCKEYLTEKCNLLLDILWDLALRSYEIRHYNGEWTEKKAQNRLIKNITSNL